MLEGLFIMAVVCEMYHHHHMYICDVISDDDFITHVNNFDSCSVSDEVTGKNIFQ